MKEAYVSFETAKILKKKGFDWDCNAIYGRRGEFQRNTDKAFNNGGLHVTSAPTHQMACAWVREKGYHIYTFRGVDYWVFEIQSLNEDWTYSLGVFKEHDDAMEAALKYSLENLI